MYASSTQIASRFIRRLGLGACLLTLFCGGCTQPTAVKTSGEEKDTLFNGTWGMQLSGHRKKIESNGTPIRTYNAQLQNPTGKPLKLLKAKAVFTGADDTKYEWTLHFGSRSQPNRTYTLQPHSEIKIHPVVNLVTVPEPREMTVALEGQGGDSVGSPLVFRLTGSEKSKTTAKKPKKRRQRSKRAAALKRQGKWRDTLYDGRWQCRIVNCKTVKELNARRGGMDSVKVIGVEIGNVSAQTATVKEIVFATTNTAGKRFEFVATGPVSLKPKRGVVIKANANYATVPAASTLSVTVRPQQSGGAVKPFVFQIADIEDH